MADLNRTNNHRPKWQKDTLRQPFPEKGYGYTYQSNLKDSCTHVITNENIQSDNGTCDTPKEALRYFRYKDIDHWQGLLPSSLSFRLR